MKYKVKSLKLLITLFCFFILTGCPLVDKLSGASGKDPAKFFSEASPQAITLVEKAWHGLPGEFINDFHVHVAGGKEDGSFVSPSGKAISKISNHLKLAAYLSAAQVKDKTRIDDQYIPHLVKIARNSGHQMRLYLLAFDKHYDRNGNAALDKTEFYVPNDYVMKLSRQYPDIFSPVISVHPYRKDAIDELKKWADQGVRIVKWLPNVQGINPADEAIVPFYQAMKKYNMFLLTHAGEEYALDSHGQQHLGNPLLLRKPLDLGVKVIIAHCASAGKNKDLENPQKKKIHNFDLFLRLMDEKKYEGLLFADISGVTQFNRMDVALSVLINRQDLHHRLLNGSDYPLPAINILIHTSKLAKEGYVTEEEQKALNEIFDYNPLLFDFVLKRTVRLPGTERRFSDIIFQNNPLLIAEKRLK